MSTYEARVLRWPLAEQERWYELAGKLMSDGVRQELADQRAFLALSRERQARGAA